MQSLNSYGGAPQICDASDERVLHLKNWMNSAPGTMRDRRHGDTRTYRVPDNGDVINCVCWNGEYLITGTDIVRILSYRFRCRNIPIQKLKKLEEGVFSDLRSLKAGTEALLEEPKSDLLRYLYDLDAIRTQKKQKVFFWFKVAHDNLFHDALERELRRLAGIGMSVMLLNQMQQHGHMQQQGQQSQFGAMLGQHPQHQQQVPIQNTAPLLLSNSFKGVVPAKQQVMVKTGLINPLLGASDFDPLQSSAMLPAPNLIINNSQGLQQNEQDTRLDDPDVINTFFNVNESGYLEQFF